MQAIAEESHSESKWKQLGELAMSAGKVLSLLEVHDFILPRLVGFYKMQLPVFVMRHP